MIECNRRRGASIRLKSRGTPEEYLEALEGLLDTDISVNLVNRRNRNRE
jgi:hypothetical protein